MQISAGNPITDYESPALTVELQALQILAKANRIDVPNFVPSFTTHNRRSMSIEYFQPIKRELHSLLGGMHITLRNRN
jgi:hypothetical protein